MKTSGIYQIQSKIKHGRVYIGSAINIQKRWCLHRKTLKKGTHHSIKLQKHYNKYGEDDLQYSILIGCDKENLIKTEQYFIDSYNPYFNICKLAGSRLGVKQSEETKKKISKSLKCIIIGTSFKKGNISWNKGGGEYSEETKQKMSISQKARIRVPHTEETKEKMRQYHKRNPLSKEARKKLSEINKNRIRKPVSQETRIKMGKSHKGSHRSEETKRKMSESARGNKRWLGLEHSEETKAKMRISQKLRWQKRYCDSIINCENNLKR